LDADIDDEIASLMVNEIKERLRVTLTNQQLRRISTIISVLNESTKADDAGASEVPIPSNIKDLRQDDSSESRTSSLTDTSKFPKVPVDSENRTTYSSFLHYEANTTEQHETVTHTTNEKSHHEQVEEQVVHHSVSIEEDHSSNNNMPPPQPTAQKKQRKGKTNNSVVATKLVNDQGEDVQGDKLPAVQKNATVSNLKRAFQKTCAHQQYDGSGYNRMDEKSYFTNSYLSSRDNAPKECAECKTSFNLEKHQYAVGAKQPVHACPNACDLNEECMHALCAPCFGERATTFVSLKTGRGRRSSRQVDYGCSP
jgi:hypothetical protein